MLRPRMLGETIRLSSMARCARAIALGAAGTTRTGRVAWCNTLVDVAGVLGVSVQYLGWRIGVATPRIFSDDAELRLPPGIRGKLLTGERLHELVTEYHRQRGW